MKHEPRHHQVSEGFHAIPLHAQLLLFLASCITPPAFPTEPAGVYILIGRSVKCEHGR